MKGVCTVCFKVGFPPYSSDFQLANVRKATSIAFGGAGVKYLFKSSVASLVLIGLFETLQRGLEHALQFSP